MLRTSTLAGASAVAVALSSGAALADLNLMGGLDANYANIDATHNGGNADVWSADGHLLIPLGVPFNIQVDGGYHNANGQIDADLWDISGAAFWRGAIGDIGVAIGHGSLSGDHGGGDLNATTYGAFGEWFVGDRFTFSANGGWFNGSHSFDGHYWTLGLKFYPAQDFSISGGVDQVHVDHSGHVTDWDVGGEWQVTDATPLSVYGSYTHSDFSASSFALNTWMVGVKWRFGEPGDSTLVEGDRNNVVPNTGVKFSQALTF